MRISDWSSDVCSSDLSCAHGGEVGNTGQPLSKVERRLIMKENKCLVAIVDDDPRLLESLEELLESAGYSACSFSSASALLAKGLSDVDLLITDIRSEEHTSEPSH